MRLDDLAQIVSGLTLGGPPAKEPTSKVPYLRVANVKDGWLLLDDVKEIDATARDLDQFRLRTGDVVLTEGGDPDKLGRGTVWHAEIEQCLHQNHIFRVRFDQGQVSPEFAAYQFASKYGKAYFLANARQTTGIASINKGILSRFPFRVPPIEEQRFIASRLKAQISTAEQARQQARIQLSASSLLPGRCLTQIFESADAVEWPRHPVGDTLAFLPARSISLKGKAAIRAVTSACLTETGFNPAGVKDALMEADDVVDAIVEPGEILIARSNTPALVGRAAVFEGSDETLVASDLTMRLRCRERLDASFACAWFSYLFVTGYWRERA